MDLDSRLHLTVAKHIQADFEISQVPYQTKTEIPSKEELGFASVLMVHRSKKKGSATQHQTNKKRLEGAFDELSEYVTVVECYDRDWGNGEEIHYIKFIHYKNED